MPLLPILNVPNMSFRVFLNCIGASTCTLDGKHAACRRQAVDSLVFLQQRVLGDHGHGSDALRLGVKMLEARG